MISGARGIPFLIASLHNRSGQSPWRRPTRILFTWGAAKDWHGLIFPWGTAFTSPRMREKRGRILACEIRRASPRWRLIRAIQIEFLLRRWGILTGRMKSEGFIFPPTADRTGRKFFQEMPTLAGRTWRLILRTRKLFMRRCGKSGWGHGKTGISTAEPVEDCSSLRTAGKRGAR